MIKIKKKLYRSSHDRIVAGVCAGIADYFDVDATIVRLIWALLIFCAGTGVFIYLICAIIIPERY